VRNLAKKLYIHTSAVGQIMKHLKAQLCLFVPLAVIAGDTVLIEKHGIRQ